MKRIICGFFEKRHLVLLRQKQLLVVFPEPNSLYVLKMGQLRIERFAKKLRNILNNTHRDGEFEWQAIGDGNNGKIGVPFF